MEFIKRFLGEETGVTAAEYGIFLGTIAGVLIVAVLFYFGELGNLFSYVGTYFAKRPS